MEGPSPKRVSFVRASSVEQLTRFLKEGDNIEELKNEEELQQAKQQFEEVPGIWTNDFIMMDEDDEDVDESALAVEAYQEKAKCSFTTSFVFGLLTFFAALFLFASVLNGGLPRYSVAQATPIQILYNQWITVNSSIKADGSWQYFRFQTHHPVENITTEVVLSDSERVLPIAVYISVDYVPEDAVDSDGDEIVQGSPDPGKDELYRLAHDRTIVCSPRTVYIGVTIPYHSLVTSEMIDYSLRTFRDVPVDDTDLCSTGKLRALVFVDVLQPLFVFCLLFLTCGFSLLGLYERRKANQLMAPSSTALEMEDLVL